MANPHNIQVGQQVWFVPNLYSNEKTPRWLTVTKVGREWASFAPHDRRFHLETLAVDGRTYGSPGHIHLDQVSWAAEERRKTLLRDIRHRLDCELAAHVTSEQLEDFLNLLKNNEQQQNTNSGH